MEFWGAGGEGSGQRGFSWFVNVVGPSASSTLHSNAPEGNTLTDLCASPGKMCSVVTPFGVCCHMVSCLLVTVSSH
jgi:hypothetical protein